MDLAPISLYLGEAKSALHGYHESASAARSLGTWTIALGLTRFSRGCQVFLVMEGVLVIGFG